eukprot:365702-Chlamydomonas_euryale.AAC.9
MLQRPGSAARSLHVTAPLVTPVRCPKSSVPCRMMLKASSQLVRSARAPKARLLVLCGAFVQT